MITLLSMELLLTFLIFCNSAFAMDVVGHRGASLVAPENSLSSIKLALDYGVDGTEFDVYLTQDKKIVISHDSTLKRLARFDATHTKISKRDFNKVVSTSLTKLNYDQFKDIDIGSYLSPKFKDERVPLLADVFAILPKNKKFIVEIKDSNPEITVVLKNLVVAMELDEEQVEFISFDKAQVVRMKNELPTYKSLLLLGCDSVTKFPDMKKDIFDGYDIEICPLINKKFVQTVLKAEKLLYVWNNKARATDHEASLFRMSEFGVNLFTSDLPINVVNWHHLNNF